MSTDRGQRAEAWRDPARKQRRSTASTDHLHPPTATRSDRIIGPSELPLFVEPAIGSVLPCSPVSFGPRVLVIDRLYPARHVITVVVSYASSFSGPWRRVKVFERALLVSRPERPADSPHPAYRCSLPLTPVQILAKTSRRSGKLTRAPDGIELAFRDSKLPADEYKSRNQALTNPERERKRESGRHYSYSSISILPSSAT